MRSTGMPLGKKRKSSGQSESDELAEKVEEAVKGTPDEGSVPQPDNVVVEEAVVDPAEARLERRRKRKSPWSKAKLAKAAEEMARRERLGELRKKTEAEKKAAALKAKQEQAALKSKEIKERLQPLKDRQARLKRHKLNPKVWYDVGVRRGEQVVEPATTEATS